MPPVAKSSRKTIRAMTMPTILGKPKPKPKLHRPDLKLVRPLIFSIQLKTMDQ